MIPKKILQGWKKYANYEIPEMIEQDLIISRAIVCLFGNKIVRESVIFIGGTVINKGFLERPRRHSEDIDWVQIRCEPIGNTLNAIRSELDPWLGEPVWKKTQQSHKLIYHYTSSSGKPMKLKIEINTREHFHVLDLLHKNFSFDSGWFSGQAIITTLPLE